MLILSDCLLFYCLIPYSVSSSVVTLTLFIKIPSSPAWSPVKSLCPGPTRNGEVHGWKNPWGLTSGLFIRILHEVDIFVLKNLKKLDLELWV